jgi:hypothetical protein
MARAHYHSDAGMSDSSDSPSLSFAPLHYGWLDTSKSTFLSPSAFICSFFSHLSSVEDAHNSPLEDVLRAVHSTRR